MFPNIFKFVFRAIFIQSQHYSSRQGGFHTGDKLEIPKNIILLFQPAHSPELNPAERVWEYIRAELRWLNFNNLNQLRNKVDEILKKMTQQLIASLTGWDYILNALNIADI